MNYLMAFVAGVIVTALVFATPPLRAAKTAGNAPTLVGETTGVGAAAMRVGGPDRRCEPGKRPCRGPCGDPIAAGPCGPCVGGRGCIEKPGCRNQPDCFSPGDRRRPGPSGGAPR